MLHLVHGQHRIGGRVGPTIGDVDAGVARQQLEQQLPEHAERPLAGSLVRGPQDPGWKHVAAEYPLHFDQMMVSVDGSVVGGHRLRGEERKTGDPMPGELGNDGRGQARIGPLQLVAPVRAHRQRHHHIPQQHRDVHRRVGHQRKPECNHRVRVSIKGDRQVWLHRVAEDAFADHDRQDCRVQRDDLARPVDHDVPVLHRQFC